MAPVTGGIADAQKHRLVLLPRLGKGRLAPDAIPKAVAIPGIDLVVIIGNVLENAAQMVERDVETGRLLRDGAFVTAKAQLINGSMLVFTCDNSCTVAPRQNKAGDFVTSAGDNGLGLASVRDAAGRNGGIAQFGYSQGVFSCSIVVQRAQG